LETQVIITNELTIQCDEQQIHIEYEVRKFLKQNAHTSTKWSID